MQKNKKPQLKIAIPNKGRLHEPTVNLLRHIGLDFEIGERKLSSSVNNFDLEIIYASASNIPEYVQDGIVDIGVTGLDLVYEKDAKVHVIEKLGYGKANLVLAVPEDCAIKTIKNLNGKRVATCFTTLTKKFFQTNKIKAEVVEVDGAVEITPVLGLVDAISDLSSSGSSLRMNKLRPIETILRSEAVFIKGKKVLPQYNDQIDTLINRIRSVLNAAKKEYIMLNAEESMLPRIKNVAPGLSSPTIMQLSKPGMIAVHSVVDSNDTWRIIEELKKIGATGILVIPLEKMIP